jgi:integrase
MRGHVRKRGNTWSIFYDRPRDPDGKRRKTSKSGFKTRKEAERWLAGLVTTLDRGEYVETSKQTLGAFLEEWLRGLPARGLRPTTISFYSLLVNSYVAPRIGGIRLQHLRPQHLDGLYASLLADGRANGKGPLSVKTVREVHGTIRKALADAVRLNLVQRNVADSATPPRKSGRREMATWGSQEVARFLTFTETDRLFALWHLALSTGLRRGELLALTWDDLDLERGRLAVRRSLIAPTAEPVLSPPKSQHGFRTLALDAESVEVLRTHRRRQIEERFQLGLGRDDSALVFAALDGGWLNPRQVSRRFERLVKASGLKPIRFHDLRHSHARALVAAAVSPKVAAERLGHYSAAFFLDTYGHTDEALHEGAAAKAAAVMRGEQ